MTSFSEGIKHLYALWTDLKPTKIPDTETGENADVLFSGGTKT